MQTNVASLSNDKSNSLRSLFPSAISYATVNFDTSCVIVAGDGMVGRQVLITCFGGIGTVALDLQDADTAVSVIERVQVMSGAEAPLMQNLVRLLCLGCGQR